MPPHKILKSRFSEMLFSPFSRQCLGLRTIKIKYVYYNRAFPQRSQSLAFLKKVRGVWGHTASENFEI